MTAHRRAALAAALLLAAALTTACGSDGSGTVVEGDGWRGVLLESHHDSLTLPDGTRVEAESSIPEVADVERFEEALPPTREFGGMGTVEIVELDEGNYVRQYSELSGGGHRELRVSGICDTELISDWESEWLSAVDGGSCFWDAAMDLESGEIQHFMFYGVG